MAIFESRARALGVLFLLGAVSVSACREQARETRATSRAPASSNASTDRPALAPPVEPAAFTCLDLPGAHREELLASPDGRAVYYAEVIGEARFAGKSKRESVRPKFALFRLELGSGVPQKLVDDVDPRVAVTARGEVVFRRVSKEALAKLDADYGYYDPDYSLWLRSADGTERELTPAEPKSKGSTTVRSFAVDEKRRKVFFVWDAKLAATSLDGAEPTKLAIPGDLVWATTDDGAVLYRHGESTKILPADATTTTAIQRVGADGYGLQLVTGKNYFETSKAVVQVRGLDGSAERAVSWTAKGDMLVSGDRTQIFVQRGEPKAAKALWAGDETRGEEVASVPAFSWFRGAQGVANGDTVTLVQRDVGAHDYWHQETDVCVVHRKKAALVARSVAKADLATFEKLVPLATGDLTNATIQIWHEHGDVAAFMVEAAGPTEPAALLDRAQSLQKLVSAASGRANLGATVVFNANQVMGTARYDSEAPEHLLVGQGRIGYQAFARDQFTVEVASDFWSNYGKIDCSGKLTNYGKSPITPVVTCTIRGAACALSAQRATNPPTLAPGQSGSFRAYVGYILPLDIGSSVDVSDNGNDLPFFRRVKTPPPLKPSAADAH